MDVSRVACDTACWLTRSPDACNRLGLLQRSLRAGFRRLGLLELQLVGLGLDREQRGAFLDEAAVLVVDRLQEALHARHQIDRLDRRGVAGGIEITRDVLLHRRPTSTFGGGGGTKVFCSQPLSAANANMTKAICETAMAPCLMRPFNAAHAGERAGFISVPQFILL